MTKKAKLESFDAVADERDLLSLYFYDMETGRKPDASEREGKITARLYRALGAQAGYVVLKLNDGATSPRLVLLDALKDQYSQYYDSESLPIRCCIERLMIARNKLWARENDQEAPWRGNKDSASPLASQTEPADSDSDPESANDCDADWNDTTKESERWR